ncbi:MAG: restriction endonuclease subunit S [Muribaculaceae bacterium]|nr:restriction endonuclease subunit S [Muribaculaceae bacterium]
MSEWNDIKLSEVITDIAAGPFGSNLPKNCFLDAGFPIIDGANLKEFKVTDNITKYVSEEKARSLTRSIAKRGDVVVTISGTVGQISYIPESSKYTDYLVSQRQFRCTFDSSKISTPYIVYYFHSYEGRSKILQFANQVGVPALSQPLKNFRNIQLSIPSLSEQKKIAGILSALDEKIETNRKINARLEELAQAIFKSWFIDFEPFGGKMPEDWSLCKLEDIAIITSGKRPADKKTEYDFLQPYPIVGASSIMGYTSNFLYDEPILVIGRVGTHGIVQRWNNKCWPSDNTLVIKSSFYNFVYYILMGIDYNSLNRGSTQPLITQTDIKQIKLVLPTLEILYEFENKVSSIFKQIAILKKESERLASLRDTLLPKLMSGVVNFL